MQFVTGILRETVDDDLDLIAASVVVVGGMQRLVQVSDEVEQELERHKALLRVGARFGKLSGELLDLIEDACWRTVRCKGVRRQRWAAGASTVDVGIVDLNIDEVPISGLTVLIA